MSALRSLFRSVHLVTALAAGLVVSAVGLSGSVLTFREEIEHALYEPAVPPGPPAASLTSLLEQAAALAPERRVSLVVLPSAPGRPLEVVLQKRGARTLKEADQWSVYASPATGEIVGRRAREESFIARLRDLHFALLSGTTGLHANGWAALALVFLSLTGGVLWAQTARAGGLLAVRLSAHWKRAAWDLHRVSGILLLAFLVLVGLTGAYYAFRETAHRALAALIGPLPPRGSPVVETPGTGAPLGPDEIAARARGLVADARLAVLRPPAGPKQAWAATFHRGRREGESVDSGPTAYLDPWTGALLRLDEPRAMGLAGRILKGIEPVHFGRFGGLATKLLWVVLGAAPAFFLASGVVMWRQRSRPRDRGGAGGGGRPTRRLLTQG